MSRPAPDTDGVAHSLLGIASVLSILADKVVGDDEPLGVALDHLAREVRRSVANLLGRPAVDDVERVAESRS